MKKESRLFCFSGGGSGGAFSAGVVEAGYAHNLFDGTHPTTLLGVSTGALTAVFTAAGQDQTALGASIYCKSASMREIINLRHWPICNIDRLADMMRTTHKLDQERVRQSPVDVLVAVTSLEDGSSVLRDAKAEPDIVELVKASAALPVAYGYPVRLGDKLYIDGGVSNPLPVREAVERIHPDRIFVVGNYTEDFAHSRCVLIGILERVLMCCVGMPRIMRKQFALRHKRRIESLLYLSQLANQGVRVEYLWPDPRTHVSMLSTDVLRLCRTGNCGFNKAFELFASAA